MVVGSPNSKRPARRLSSIVSCQTVSVEEMSPTPPAFGSSPGSHPLRTGTRSGMAFQSLGRFIGNILQKLG